MFTINPLWRILNHYVHATYLVKPFWGAVASAVISAWSASQANDRANRLASEGKESRAQRLKLAQDAYNEYKTNYGPMEQDLIASIDDFSNQVNLQKYMEQASLDTAQAYDKTREMQKREMGRYGINPGSQRFQIGNSIGNERAKQEVLGRNMAREKYIQDQDKLFSRRLAAMKFGGSNNGKLNTLLSAYDANANALRQEAAGYAKQAGTGFGLVGKFAGQAVNSYLGGGGSGGYDYFDGATGSNLGEGVWEGSNYVSDADVGDLGW